MTDTSTMFTRVAPESTRVMIQLMTNRTRLTRRTLSRRFHERALHFDATLGFMASLRVLRQDGRFVVPGTNLNMMVSALAAGAASFNKCLMELVLQSRTNSIMESATYRMPTSTPVHTT